MLWKHPSSSQVLQSHLSQQGYGVCISAQWRSSDGWLLWARQDCHRCVLRWVSPQNGWSHRENALTKVDRRNAASPRQCTSAHLPCCHCRYLRVTSIFELLSHPPYSPDLAPSDFHLFRHLKDSLSGRAFEDANAVIMAVNEWIEEQEQNLFLEGVKTLEQRWEKCVALKETMLRNNEMISTCVDILCFFSLQPSYLMLCNLRRKLRVHT